MWVTIPIWLALIWASWGYLELVTRNDGDDAAKNGGQDYEVTCEVVDEQSGTRYYCYGG